MPDPEPADRPVIIKTDDARGALGPSDTPRGATMVPMLVGGLILCIGAFIIVALWIL